MTWEPMKNVRRFAGETMVPAPKEAGREPAQSSELGSASGHVGQLPVPRPVLCCALHLSPFVLCTVSVFISLFVFDNGLTYRLRHAEDVLMVRAPVQHRH